MDYTPYYETMRRTSLLRGMTDAELDTLMACFAPRVRRYTKGELLLMAGYETHEVGLVLEGAITASKPLADGSTVITYLLQIFIRFNTFFTHPSFYSRAAITSMNNPHRHTKYRI